MTQTLRQVKSCLVISYGPVPTPQYQTIEGGGMRVWGLAQGLKHNGIRVTVAINNSFPQDTSEHEGIKLVNWSQDQHFIDLINSYDAVVVSYCMGSDSVFVADNISDSVQLILDAYVPIYIEVSAREAKDLDFDYRHYMEDIQRYNHVLRRGDYFLCANQSQKTLYMGVLSALGIINPRSYREERIIIAPFGIHDLPVKADKNPFHELGIKDSDFVVMWFGGLYPWFRVDELLTAIKGMSHHKDFKFVVVGGKNPFNPNPDLARQYDHAQAFAKKHNLLNKSLYFVDWVDFDTRVNWFRHADLVVSLNQPGEENGFSWRTRVMDFVWGELAILTNGGDPLSEDLLSENAAIKLPELSAESIQNELERIKKDSNILKKVRSNIRRVKPRYDWNVVTERLAGLIAAGETPFIDEKAYRRQLHLGPGLLLGEAAQTPAGKLHRAKRLAYLPIRALSYARRKGLRRSFKLARTIVGSQVRSRVAPRGKRYTFISHPMDNTGAPIVLVQMLREYAQKYGGKNVQLITPYIAANLLRDVREMGVKVDKAAAGLGGRLTGMQLNFNKDDFVLMNTIAIYDNYRDAVLSALEKGMLKRAYWFIHEDKAQIPVINRDLLATRNVNRIKQLANQNKLTIVTPSKRTRQEYVKLLGTSKIQAIPLLVDVPAKYQKVRSPQDFATVRFFLSGAAADGRKGQLIAIAAFQEFLSRYRAKNPKNYRDFSLTLLSVGEDYISQQIRWIGNSLLGKRLSVHAQVPREKALSIAAKCNAVICCSLNETFGLYVAECMHMGHVVLRNDAAGVDEQLQDGVNGYFINHRDVTEFAAVIERILNKQTTSNDQLQAMGKASQSIIGELDKTDYLEKIELLK